MSLLEKITYTVSSPVIFWNKERETMRKRSKAGMLLVSKGAIEACTLIEIPVISAG